MTALHIFEGSLHCSAKPLIYIFLWCDYIFVSSSYSFVMGYEVLSSHLLALLCQCFVSNHSSLEIIDPQMNERKKKKGLTTVVEKEYFFENMNRHFLSILN